MILEEFKFLVLMKISYSKSNKSGKIEGKNGKFVMVERSVNMFCFAVRRLLFFFSWVCTAFHSIQIHSVSNTKCFTGIILGEQKKNVFKNLSLKLRKTRSWRKKRLIYNRWKVKKYNLTVEFISLTIETYIISDSNLVLNYIRVWQH